jgi:hypothetical protein
MTEYLTNMEATEPFTLQQVKINPGDETVFPYLSGLANNYEEYKFERLTFQYKTTCSTLTDGSSYFAFNPDSREDAPTDKIRFMSFHDAKKAGAWESYSLTVPRERLKVKRYISTGDLPSDTDIHFYDVGSFYAASEGNSGNVSTPISIGEVYVSYRVVLSSPRRLVDNGSPSMTFATTSSIPPNPFDGATPHYSVPVPGVTTTADKIEFSEPGQYKIDIDWTGAGLTDGNPFTTSNAADFGSFNTYKTGFVNSTSTKGWYSYLIDVLDFAVSDDITETPYVHFDFGAIATTLTDMLISVTPLVLGYIGAEQQAILEKCSYYDEYGEERKNPPSIMSPEIQSLLKSTNSRTRAKQRPTLNSQRFKNRLIHQRHLLRKKRTADRHARQDGLLVPAPGYLCKTR